MALIYLQRPFDLVNRLLDAGMAVQFLLASHELMLGNLQAGARESEAVLAINSNEPVTRKLLEVVQCQLQNEAST